MQSLPVFYFPSTILCVDDDKNILKVLEDNLFSLNYIVRTVSESQDALKIIKNISSVINTNLFNDLSRNYDYAGLDITNSSVCEFNFSKLLSIIANPRRSEELSLVVVDYLMPKINGVELCREIADSCVKKILLTGEAGNSEAVDAFNDGLINCYIPKGESNTISKLLLYVNKLTKQYFIDKTAPLRSYLENFGLTSLSDPVFVNFFEELISKKSIKEFYLIDKSGSFLLINNRNEKLVLIVHNDNSLNELVELFYQEPKVFNMIEAMKLRQKIPFFGVCKNPADIPLDNWEKHFHKIELLKGQQKYYWNLFSLEEGGLF